MPTECITSVITGNTKSSSLQRKLAESIERMQPLDDIRILIAEGAKVNEPVTRGLRPLHYAVWKRYYEATVLLLTRGGDVNAVDECGYSPLHLCAEYGYTEVVRLLLMSGAKVDYRPNTPEEFPRTIQGDEPLRLAIRNKHMEIARMLLEHGADPNKRYFFGAEINLVTDLEYLELLLTFGANPDSRDRSGLTPLMKAVRQQKGMEAALILLKYGADVNAMADERHDYRTVLHYAVLSGSYDMINLLIKQGAKLNYPEEFALGKPSPLDLVILKGDAKIVQLLIESGADVNASSPLLGSPLHVACADSIRNRYEILEMLLKSGANPNLKVYNDPEERTRATQLRPVLVDYLASNENPSLEIVQLLLTYGARVIMKTQFRDPDGILNSLHNVVSSARCDALFRLLVDASESFDPCMIRRNTVLTPVQKKLLLELASCPLSLRKQVRLFLRTFLGQNPSYWGFKSELPKCLVEFLFFERG